MRKLVEASMQVDWLPSERMELKLPRKFPWKQKIHDSHGSNKYTTPMKVKFSSNGSKITSMEVDGSFHERCFTSMKVGGSFHGKR